MWLPTVAITTLTALAQEVAPAPETRTWVGGLIVIFLFLIIVGASIKSSKRTHQD